jgi:hypothetical protein
MSLINRLKSFCTWHRIREIIDSKVAKIGFSGVIDTAESENQVNPQLFSASSTCIVWGYLPMKYFCWIFPLTEEKELVKSV